ncbi:hypothetical protein HDU67_006712 [Dinochytrium kinnereticum]|nr:hypothetical protein HDU67_006712 [Dinochytrium kinnereticum]
MVFNTIARSALAVAVAASAVSAITIAEIQGTKWMSPYNGQVVEDITGVVTVVDVNTRGIYIQSLEPDNDPRTSEALFVDLFSQTPLFNTLVFTDKVRPGTILNIAKGLVNETHPNVSAQGYVNYQTTLKTVEGVTAKGVAAVPAPLRLGDKTFNYYYSEDPYSLDGTAGVAVQLNLTATNPVLDLSRAHDYFESIENMFVEVAEPLVTSRNWNSRFVQLPVVPNAGKGSLYLNSNGGVTMAKDSPQPIRLLVEAPINIDFVEGKTTQTPLPADAVMGDILSTFTATISWRFDSWHLRPASGPVTIAKPNSKKFDLTPKFKKDSCNLAIATYNIENFFLSQNETRNKFLADHIANNLGSPDILFLQEVGDDDGLKNDTIALTEPVVASDINLQGLADLVHAAGGPKYSFTYAAPVNGTDGGQPLMNIRNAYFYNPERVSFPVLGGLSGPLVPQEVLKDGSGPVLKYNPGRIDPLNPAWDLTRKPLVAQFEFNGVRVFAINNHLSSKGGSSPLAFGNLQPPLNGGYKRRMDQSESLIKFINEIYAFDPNAIVLMGGDHNEFYFTGAPLNIVSKTPLANMFDLLPIEARYSYSFDGINQALDHIFAPRCAMKDAEILPIHINLWGPNLDISDHDPIAARINICDCKKTTTTTFSSCTAEPTSASTTTTTTTTATTTASADYTVTKPGESTSTKAATASSTTPCDSTSTKAATATSTPVDYSATKPGDSTSTKAPVASTTPCDSTSTKAATATSTPVDYSATKPAATSTKAPVASTTPCDDDDSTKVPSTKAPAGTTPVYGKPTSTKAPVVSTEEPCEEEDEDKKYTATPPALKTTPTPTPATKVPVAVPTSFRNLVQSGGEKMGAGVVGVVGLVAVLAML